MMINYSKKYGGMTALFLLVLINAPLSLANNQPQKPKANLQPFRTERIQPKTPKSKSPIIVQPQASRRASQCIDNGVC